MKRENIYNNVSNQNIYMYIFDQENQYMISKHSMMSG